MALAVTQPQTDTIIFGFDSAWSDKSPGAICALAFDSGGGVTFHTPQAARFAEAFDHITERRQSYACVVVALDQPTIVPNKTGMRPAERVAASLLSFTGGGVQPANRSKESMFGDCAPIWDFKKELRACDDPAAARCADNGTYLLEAFPALALPGLVDDFAQLKCAPKYNPRNSRKFRQKDWIAVVENVAAVAKSLGLADLGAWCSRPPMKKKPTKREQDCLDAAICVLVGFIWRACVRNDSVLIGDLQYGYIVAPASATTKARLASAAGKRGVPFA